MNEEAKLEENDFSLFMLEGFCPPIATHGQVS
jgi:hypothetical protein